jgi:hypothetical protein
MEFFRAALPMILRSKIVESAALKNIIWRLPPPNNMPDAFYITLKKIVG